MPGDYTVATLAVPESLDLLHELLERVSGEHPDVAPDDLMMFETAIIEIAGNVVEHGSPVGQVVYEFTLDVFPDRLEAELIDNGYAFAEAEGSGVVDGASLPDDAMDEAGRGLFLAVAVLDELRYSRVAGRNVWNMVRRRS
ncbi:MAG: ATP-binding protein [Terracoccus sp.]